MNPTHRNGAPLDRAPRGAWRRLAASIGALALGLPLVLGGLALVSRPATAQEEPGESTPLSADSVAVAAPAAGDSAAASAGPNPRIAATRKVRLVGGARNVVRSGPGDSFAIAGVYPAKSEFTVIAKSGDWYGIRLSETETGWIHSSLCKEFDDLSGLEFRPNPRAYSRVGSFIVGGYAGGYAFDRKSNSLVLGGRLGYYVLDRLQVEAGLGWTHIHRPAEIVESLFGLTLESEDYPMLFYHLIGSWELMPGRQMVPYVTAGVGSALMQGESEASFNFGAGTTLYLSKRHAMRWEVRDYRFSSGTAAARRHNNNIEFTLGSLILF